MFKLFCITCGELMPLGTATDTPETAVEVRAAALARQQVEENAPPFTWPEADDGGWIRHYRDEDPRDDEWAGWLAREIWTHEQETP